MKLLLALVAVLVALLMAAALYVESDPGGPIPAGAGEVPAFIGETAVPRPVDEALAQPTSQHPFLAGAGLNSMHNDAAQSDSYRWAGPLGKKLQVSSRQFHRIAGSCVAQTFPCRAWRGSISWPMTVAVNWPGKTSA